MNIYSRLVIFGLACLVAAAFLFRDVLAELPVWLSPEGLKTYGVFHWGVGGLCVIWLWLKRRPLLDRMKTGSGGIVPAAAGTALLALGAAMPVSGKSMVFPLVLGFLGIFTTVFRRAWAIPAVLVAVYGFSLGFPLAAAAAVGEPSSRLAALVVGTVARLFGVPAAVNGVTLTITGATGQGITIAVLPECGGYASIGAFISLFTLIMLDTLLPFRYAWYTFIVGLIGTWIQNIVRILIAVAAGYHGGTGAIEAVHYNLAYLIFPLWFAFFVWFYFRQPVHRVDQTVNLAARS